ncbi:YadA-like family protein [Veillonella sp. 3891]|uniref:YadA-like family protein n=1 Tax=Veillonella sp. 3891 TaxID=2490951 RepID=UPI0013DEF6A8|nr:YadA-like family protein [Veillonella sp. 3891]
MKSSQIFLECERFLKRALKDKGRYSKGAVIAFLITGGIAVPSVVQAVIPTNLLGLAFDQAGISGYNRYDIVTSEGGADGPKGKLIIKPKHVDFGGMTTAEKNEAILDEKVNNLGQFLTLRQLYAMLYHNPLATKTTDFYGLQDSKTGTALKVNQGYVTYQGATITGGESTHVNGTGAIALGGNSKASGEGTIALGLYSDASASPTAVNNGNITYGPSLHDNIAIGFKSESHDDYTVALGARANANAAGSNAIGFNTQAAGKSSLAIGYNTYANVAVSDTNNLASKIDGMTNAVSDNTRTKMKEYADLVSDYTTHETRLNQLVAMGNTSEAQAEREWLASQSRDIEAKRTELEALPDYNALVDNAGTTSNNTDLQNALNKTGGVSKLIDDNLNKGFDYNSPAASNALNLSVKKKILGDTNGVFREVTEKQGDNAIAIGNYTLATGNASIAQGVGAYTKADASIALGSLAHVGDKAAQSIAIGTGAQAHDENSVAMGVRTATYGAGDVAIGNRTTVLGDSSVGIGFNSAVLSNSGTAIGKSSRINGGSIRSVALGERANVGGGAANSIAIGFDSNVGDNALNSVAIGTQAKSLGRNSLSFGSNTESGKASINSVTIGNFATTNAENAVALGGSSSVATGATRGIAIGQDSKVNGVDTVGLGTGVRAVGTTSIVIGNKASAGVYNTNPTKQSGADNVVVIGQGASALRNNSIVLGHNSNDTYEALTWKLKPGVSAYANLDPKQKYEFDSNGDVILEKRDAMTIPSYLPRDSKLGHTLEQLDKQGLGVVSVGGGLVEITNESGTKERVPGLRRITNVAPGALDNDVVTVAQLRDWRGKAGHFLSVNHTVAGSTATIGENSTANVGYNAAGDAFETRRSNYNNDEATGAGAMALGVYTKSTGERATAVGYGAGTYGKDSVGIGTKAYTGGEDAVAVGSQAKARANHSIALGVNAETKVADSVALGAYSVATIDKGVTGWNPANGRRNHYDNKLTGITLTSTNAGISIGSERNTRQIHHLAAGTENTDAVNVAQVKALNLKIAGNTTSNAKADVRLHDQTLTVKGDGNYITTNADNNTITVGLTQDAINKINAAGTPVHYLSTKGGSATDGNIDVNGIATESNYNNTGAVGNQSVALGSYARSAGAGTVAVGFKAATWKDSSIAIGDLASARENSTIAIGKRATSYSTNAVAIGTSATGKGNSTVAIGDSAAVNADANDKAGSWNGTWQGNNAVAIGANATAKRDQDVAIGASATVKGGDAVAIGSSSNTLGENSIAIGSHAQVEDATTVVKDANNKTTDERTPANSIAIGRYAYTNQKETIVMGTKASVNAKESVAIGQTAKIEAGAIDSIALGKEATIKANAEYGTAIGQGATINTGATYGIAIGQGAQIDPNATYATAIGQGARVQSTEGTALGKGANAANAQGTALGTGASVTVDKGVALGAGSVAGIAAGVNAWDPADARRNNYAAIRSGVAATSGAGAVSVGSDTATRQITNLAGGTNDTDAVNVAQLKAMNLKLAGNTTATAGADVRLSEQSLTVKGTDGYITTNADNNEITVTLTDKAKASLFVTSFTGDQGSKVTPTATSNTVNVTGKKFSNLDKASEPNSIWADGNVRYETGNVGTYTTGNTIGIGLRPDLKSKSFTTYRYDGNHQTNDAGPSISYDGINMNNKPITNLQAGTNPNDAVNKSQLDAVTWDLGVMTNGNSAKVVPTTVANDNKRINLKGEGNVTVTADGSTITIKGETQDAIVVYTDANGNRVYKREDGYFYKSKDPVAGESKVAAANVQSRLVNANGNSTTAPTVLNNVKSVIQTHPVAGNNAPTFADRLNAAEGTNPSAAVNVKDLHSAVTTVKNNELHITPMEYTPNGDGDVTLTYSDGNGSVVPNTTAKIKGVAKKSDLWSLSVNGEDVTPKNNKVNLKNGDNISISKDANGNVTIAATGLAKTDLSNIDNVGKSTITGLTEVKAGKNITVTPTTDVMTGKKTYTVAANDQVESVTTATLADDENIATVTMMDNTVDKTANARYGVGVSKKAVANIAKDAVEVKAGDNADNVTVDKDTNTEGKTIYKVSVAKTKLATGTNTTVEGKGTEAEPYKVNVEGALSKITSIANEAGSGKVTFDNNGIVKVDGDKAVSIDGKQGYVTGLQNTTLTATDFAKANRAATEEQLKAVKDIADAASTTDYRLIANPVDGSNGAYKVDNGTISLKVKDTKQPDSTPDTITISDVASKQALDTVKANQWDLAVASGTDTDGTKVTPKTVTGEDNKRIVLKGESGVTVKQDGGVITIGAEQGIDNDTITTVSNEDGTVTVTPSTTNAHAYDVKVDAKKLGEAQALIFVDDKGKQVFKQPDGTFKDSDGKPYNGTVHTKVNTTGSQRVDNVGSAIDGAKVTTDAGLEKPNATYLEKLEVAAKDPVTGKAAVNVSDLKKTSDASIEKAVNEATTKGMKFQGNTGDAISKELGQTLEVKGEGTLTGNTAANNIRTKNNGGVLEIGLAESLTGINSIAGKGGTTPLTISNGGTTLTINAPEGDKPSTISVGDAKITDVANGTGDKDAVNVSQLNAVANKELHIKPTTDTEKYTVDTDGNVTLTYVNGDGTTVADTKAVISGVAKNDLSNITNAGKKVITDLGPTINAGDGITVTPGTLDANTGKQSFTIAANKQVESVTTATLADDENIATVTMMDNTVDKTANARYGVGVSKKAVANIAKDAVEVKAGDNADNVTVDKDTNTEGKTIYKVSVAKTKLATGTNTTVEGKGTEAEPYKVNVEGALSKITSIANEAGSGKVTFDNNGIVKVDGDKAVSIDGKQGYVTGLQNTEWNVKNPTAVSGRAATEDQLKAVNDEVNNKADKTALWDLAVNNGTSTDKVDPQATGTEGENKRITLKGSGAVKVTQENGVITIGAEKGTDNDTITTVSNADGTVTVTPSTADAHAYDVKVNKQAVVDGAQLPVVYTTKDGKKVTIDKDGKFHTADGAEVAPENVETRVQSAAKDTTKGDTILNNVGSAIANTNVPEGAGNKQNPTFLERLAEAAKEGNHPNAAVNVSDLKNASDASIAKAVTDATDKGMKYGANLSAKTGGDKVVTNKLGSTVNIVGSADVTNATEADKQYDGKNVLTSIEQDADGNTTVTVKLNKDLTSKSLTTNTITVKGDPGANGQDGKDAVVTVGEKGEPGKDGSDGKIGVNGKDGSAVVINGKDGSIGLNGPKGADGQPGKSINIRMKDGYNGQDGTDGVPGVRGEKGVDGQDGIARIVYTEGGKEHQVATMDDGLRFTGNNSDTENKHRLNTLVNIVGEGVAKEQVDGFKSASGNILVAADGKTTLTVKMNKNLANISSITNAAGNGKVEFKDNGVATFSSGNNDANGTDTPVVINGKDGKVTTGTVGFDGKAGTVKANDITVGKQSVTPGENGVAPATGGTLTEGNFITGLDNKDWNVASPSYVSGRAATEDQLKKISEAISAKSGSDYRLVANKEAGSEGKYKPTADGDINLTVEDPTDATNTKTVTITDVAKKSELDTVKGQVGNTIALGDDTASGTTTAKSLKDGNVKFNIKGDGKYISTAANGDNVTVSLNTKQVAQDQALIYVDNTGKQVFKQPDGTFKDADGNAYNGDVHTKVNTPDAKRVDNVGSAIDTAVVKDAANQPKQDATYLEKLEAAAKDPVTGKSAVNVSDLKNASDASIAKAVTDATDKGMKYGANLPAKAGGDKVVTNKLGSTVNIVGSADVTNASEADKQYDGKNVLTSIEQDADGHTTVTVKLNKDLTSKSLTTNTVTVKGEPGANGQDGRDAVVTVGEKGEPGVAGKDGSNGTIGVNGKDGSAVVINGKDGSIGMNGKDGANGLTMKGDKGAVGLDGTDGANGKDGMTRIVYETKHTDPNNAGKEITVKHEVATMDDGQKYSGDNYEAATATKAEANVINKKLNERLEIVGGAAKDKLTDNNIGVNAKDGKLKVQLASDLTSINSITNKEGNGKVAFGENGTTTFSSGAETGDKTVSIDGKAGKVTVGTGGNPVVVDGSIGDITGLTNKTLDAADFGTKGRAATEEQLKLIQGQLGTGKLSFGANLPAKTGGKNVVENALGSTVNIVGTANVTADDNYDGNNVVTTVEKGTDGNTTVTVKLNKDLTSKSVTTNTVTVKGEPGANGQDGKDAVVTVGEKGEPGKDGSNGTIGINGKDGSAVVINGKDGSIGLTGPKGENGNSVVINGKDGKIGAKGEDGKSVVINGKDGTIGLTGPKGADGAPGKSLDIGMKDGYNGQDGADGVPGVRGEKGVDGKDGITRIVYTTKEVDPVTKVEKVVERQVATMDDGLQFTGNNSDTVNKHRLNTLVNIVGEGVSKEAAKTFESAEGNILVDADGKDALTLRLNKHLNLTNTGSMTVGNSVVNNAGLTVKDGANESKVGSTGATFTDGTNTTEVAPTVAHVNGVKDANGAVTGGVVIGKQSATPSADGKTPTATDTAVEGNFITGLENKDWNVTDPKFVSGRAATEDQLKTVSDAAKAVANNTIQFGADNASKTDTQALNKQGGIAFNITGGADKDKLSDNNIGVNANGSTVEVKLAKELKGLTSAEFTNADGTTTKVEAGKVTTGDTVLSTTGLSVGDQTTGTFVTKTGTVVKDGDVTTSTTAGETVYRDGDKATTVNTSGITIENGDKTVSLTNTGLDNGGNKIINVARGENDTDAVNVAQLNDEVGKAKTTVTVNGEDKDANKNLSLTVSTADDGHTNYDIRLADKVTLGTDAAKQVTMDGTAGTVTAGTGDNIVKVDGSKGQVVASGVTVGKQSVTPSADGKTPAATDKATEGNFITGLDNKTWDVTNPSFVSGRAATEDQLKSATTGLVDKGLVFDANTGGAKTNKLGSTVKIQGTAEIPANATDADKNYDGKNVLTSIEQDDQGNTTVTVKLNKDLTSKSVTTNTITVKGESGKDGKPGTDAIVSVGEKGEPGANGKDGKPGSDGVIGVNGKDGSAVVINGKDGSIGLNGKDGKNGLSIKGDKGVVGVDGTDGANGKDGMTRIVYETKHPDPNNAGKDIVVKHEVATMDDGVKYAGDDAQGTDKSKVIAKKLNQTVDIIGGAAKEKLTDNNIGVNNVDGKLKVQLASDLTSINSITNKENNGKVEFKDKGVTTFSGGKADDKAVSIDGKQGFVTGLQNKDWNVAKPTVVSGRAATEDQLKVVSDRLAEARKFTGDNKDVTAVVGLGDVLNINGGADATKLTDNNIGVIAKEAVKNADGTVKTPASMTVKLAKNIHMGDGSTDYTGVFKPTFIDKDGKVKPVTDEKTGKPVELPTTVKHDGAASEYTVYRPGKDGKPEPAITTNVTPLGVVIESNNSNGKANPAVTLTANGLDNGGNRIINVAPGINGTDGVNVDQLKATANNVLNQATGEAHKAGARAAALAALKPLQYDPLEPTQIMAGVGNYRSETAAAVGIAHYTQEATMFHVGVTLGQHQNMVNAGVTHKFGWSPEEKAIPERYKAGPISSVYVMQDEVSALKQENERTKVAYEQVLVDNANMRAENQEMKESYNKMAQDNEEMKAQIKMLMQAMGMK